MKFYFREDIPIHLRLKEDAVYKFQLDCSGWVEENGTITSTTVTVRSGEVTAGTATVSSNVITFSLTQTSEGVSRVEIKFTDGTYTGVQNLFVRYEDNEYYVDDDYGLSWNL